MKERKNYPALFAILFILFLGPCCVAYGAESDKVAVEAEGAGPTKKAALQEAWIDAVRKAVGLFMTAKTESLNDDLTEKIVTHSRGQVNSWKVLSEKEENGLWTVAIEAEIDRDILQETAAQGQSHKMALDGADIAARQETAGQKRASAQEILTDTLNGLDLASLLRYRSELKKDIQEDGSVVIYVRHFLSVDPERFKIIAGQLEKSLAPVAKTRETVQLKNSWGKKVMPLLKDWTFAPEKLKPDTLLINPGNKDVNMNGRDFTATDPVIPDSVCVFRNASSAVCYGFDKQIMKSVYDSLKIGHNLRFEASGGDDFSEKSKAFRLYWPLKLSSNVVMIAPVGEIMPTNVATLLYNQKLDLDQDQLLEMKEITGSYSLTSQ